MKANSYRNELVKNAANYVPLSPVSFLARSALAYPDKIAVIDGARRFTYQEFHRRCLRFASALCKRGIDSGDTVAILAPNVPALLEAHYGVPLAGAVLNALNIRLDASAIAYCLGHGDAKLLLVDEEYLDLAKTALDLLKIDIPLIMIRQDFSRKKDEIEYEEFLGQDDAPQFPSRIVDEWSPITLGYTSGTTGNPKGVVCHHRGAYLNALGNALAARMSENTAYLWTLPMFHCNGWSHTWAVTSVGGTHICLRKIDPSAILDLIVRENITHLSAAPIVLNMLANAPEIEGIQFKHRVNVLTGGSVPPTPILKAIEDVGFNIMHIYGLTETTGPSLFCEWREEWDALSLEDRMQINKRQGVNLITLEDAKVISAETGNEVPWDGKTIGEISLRGNTVMMGYLKDPEATAAALAGGYFHTGDLAVRHPDGYIEIRDRSKDIIISGGENISSVEIEEILYRHPAIYEAAVVSRPDEKWGEHPCAFISFKENCSPLSTTELTEYCLANLARFKVPKTFIFGALPKTATGKVQKYLLRERASNLTSH